LEDASLGYDPGSGNIHAEKAARVHVVSGSFVDGSIQIVQSGAADILDVDINTDLYFDDNDLFLNAANNNIGGNLQAFQNTGGDPPPMPTPVPPPDPPVDLPFKSFIPMMIR
jgi:hypothetical protein